MSPSRFVLLSAIAVLAIGIPLKAADEPQKADKSSADSRNQEALHKLFQERLSGVKLVGHYTMQGREDGPLPKEEYTINSVEKLPDGDYWLFNTRIKYGDKDITAPMPLQVKWAGDTPVITLTDVTIPGLGTFSARVVIHGQKYAGTWSHGEAGGHIFGAIEKLAGPTTEPAKSGR